MSTRPQQRKGECHVKIQGEDQPSAIRGKRPRTASPTGPSERTNHANVLILDFQALKL